MNVVIISDGPVAEDFTKAMGLKRGEYRVACGLNDFSVFDGYRSEDTITYYLWTRIHPMRCQCEELLDLAYQFSRAVVIVTDWR